MSKEMKMTDVFKFPVRKGQDCIFDWDNNILAPFDAAVCAINNHDRLVEENAALRDIVTRLISSGVAYQNLEEIKFDLDSDDIASIEAKFNDELIRADKLITELGGGDD